MTRTILSRCATVLACAALPLAAHAQSTCTRTFTYSPQNPVAGQPVTVSLNVVDSVAPLPSQQDTYFVSAEVDPPGQLPQMTSEIVLFPGVFSFTFTPSYAGRAGIFITDFYNGNEGNTPPCGDVVPQVNTVIDIGSTAPTYDGFKGQYAFAFNGLNPQIQGASTRLAAVGSFSADGLGHITAGIEDINSGAGSSTLVPITGSYTIDAAGHGALTLASRFGVQQLSFFVPASERPQITGTSLFSKDGYVVFGTGSLQLQTATGLNLTDQGDYALNLSGYLPCTSTCNGGDSIFEAGSLSFAANAAGNYGTLSSSIGAVLLPDISLGNTNFSGVDPGTGRFTFTLTQGPLPAVPFVGYTIDGVHLLLLSTDSHKTTYLLHGTAVHQ